MKKIIILEHNEGRLGNQLWNYISIYAYCLEKGYECDNWSFFEYEKYFENIKTGNIFVRIFFKNILMNFVKSRKAAIFLYRRYISLVKILNQEKIIYSDTLASKRSVFYLPPTKKKNHPFNQKEMEKIKVIDGKKRYFSGWMFRNPVGIEKYRKKIKKRFKPEEKSRLATESFVSELREKYDYLIGVHIRQGDYTALNGRKFYFSQEQVYKILLDLKKNLKKKKCCFIICSNGKININIFKKIDAVKGPNEVIEDLYALSLTDFIIGSNSTYGAFASYWGNIPMAVFSREKINWSYYLKKKGYFENKDCTMVHY